MDTSSFDPFNLLALTQDIDGRCFRVMAKDFPAVVSETGLVSIKEKLLQEIAPLLAEVMNDLQDLQRYLKSDEIIGTGRTGSGRLIPGVKEMVEELPRVYRPLNLKGDLQADQAVRESFCLDRVKWIVDTWVQISGHLTQRLSAEVPVTKAVEDDGQTYRVPRPLEINSLNSTWQLLRRTTVEYLQAKADLLRVRGEDVPHVAANLGRGKKDTLNDALEAFWENRVYASTLLLSALREALVNLLKLNGPDVPIDLRLVLTSRLVDAASSVGLPLPHDSEVVIQLAAELEKDFYYTSAVRLTPIALLYPAVRILAETVDRINALPPQPAVREGVIQVLTRTGR